MIVLAFLDGVNIDIGGKTGTANNFFTTIQTINKKVSSNNQVVQMKTTHFNSNYSTDKLYTDGSKIGIAIRTNGSLAIGFGINSDINTIDKAKQFIRENNVTIYYPLETPYTVDLGVVDITLFNGINHISNSEDADMSITYVKDINIVINKLTNAIVSLGGNI